MLQQFCTISPWFDSSGVAMQISCLWTKSTGKKPLVQQDTKLKSGCQKQFIVPQTVFELLWRFFCLFSLNCLWTQCLEIYCNSWQSWSETTTRLRIWWLHQPFICGNILAHDYDWLDTSLEETQDLLSYTVRVKASFTITGKEVTFGKTSSSLFKLVPFCLEVSYPYPSLAANH